MIDKTAWWDTHNLFLPIIIRVSYQEGWGACSMYAWDGCEKFLKILVWNHKGKKSLRRPKHRFEDDITGLEEQNVIILAGLFWVSIGSSDGKLWTAIMNHGLP